MKTNIKTVAVILAASSIVFLNSCKKEDESVSKPIIDLLELGLNDSHLAYIGGDLHI